MNKRGLGRGLQALIPNTPVAQDGEGMIRELAITAIRPNPQQPRREFKEEKLAELATSIKEHGVIQPVVVRPVGEGSYELIAGERRWRACLKLGLDTIPAIIKEVDDLNVTELSLVENIQREDLNPLEEATAYRRLMNEFGFTQEKLSERVGKSRSYIANSVRLLNLPPKVQELVADGILSTGHAKALLGISEEKKLMEMAERAARDNLTVREVENLVQLENRPLKISRKQTSSQEQDGAMREIEERLREIFNTKVNIKKAGKGGKIEICYYSEEELQRIVETILDGQDV
ncbi:MAG: ParB/RepB/Spo0J family partition protein [Firmicutes bacterium]|nr:ParB/RepB/Spo0J family partition protein [Bacillota bacterium]